MERRVKVFSSFEEEEKATREYYLSLTPQQRLDILFELIERSRDPNDEASQRFERVYRVVQLSQKQLARHCKRDDGGATIHP